MQYLVNLNILDQVHITVQQNNYWKALKILCVKLSQITVVTNIQSM